MNQSFAVKTSALQDSLVEMLQRSQKSMVDTSRATWCRLCIKNCLDYKSLYDENGYRNSELYEMTAKYFHPLFLTLSKGKKLTVICMECWHTIYEFHHFQNTIVLAQAELLDKQVEPVVASCEGEASSLTRTSANAINGIAMTLPCIDNEIDSKEGLSHLRERNLEDDVGNDMSSVIGIRGSIGDRSSITESETIAQSPTKTRFSNTVSHKSQNRVNVTTDEEIFDDDFNDSMEFSQKDMALIDLMECKSNDNDPLSLRANKTNTNETNDDETANSENNAQLTQKSRELQTKRLDDLIAQWGQPLNCPVCKEPISNYSALREHFDTNHSHNDFYIMCCNRKFRNRFQIEEHVQLHLNPIGYECDICKATFTAKGALKRHKIHQHFMPKAKKPSTSKKKQYVKSVKDLDAVIARWKPNLQCVFCNALHPNFEVLRRHFHLEHPKEQCYISCCQQKLETRWRIVEHARFHMDPKSFRCKFCNKRETSRKTLWDHMHRDHSIAVGLKKDEARQNYKCPTCDKVLKSLNTLKAHMNTHAVDDLLSTRITDQLPQGHEEGVDVSQTGEEQNNVEDMDSFQSGSQTSNNTNDFSFQPDPFSQAKSTRQVYEPINDYHKYQYHFTDTKVPARRNHKCSTCNQIFKSLNTLKAHMDTHTVVEFSSQHLIEQLHQGYEEPLDGFLPDVKPMIEDIVLFPTVTTLIDSKDFHSHPVHRSLPNRTQNENMNEHKTPVGKYQTDQCTSETKEEKIKRLDDLVAQWGQSLECPICKESLINYSTLRHHFENQHAESPFFIVCCDHKLNTRFHIEEHIRLHMDPTIFKCEICGTTFSARSSFKRHMQHQHGNSKKTLKRTQRSKQTSPQRKQYHKSVKELDAIIRRWKPNLQCDLCDAIHPNFEVMRRHFRLEHTNEKCYILCCQRKLETRLLVAEHARFHMDPKKFRCKYCNERYVSKRQLRDHIFEEHCIQISVEKNEQASCNHKCNVCDKVFQSQDNLQEHAISHVGMDLKNECSDQTN